MTILHSKWTKLSRLLLTLAKIFDIVHRLQALNYCIRFKMLENGKFPIPDITCAKSDNQTAKTLWRPVKNKSIPSSGLTRI